MYLLRALIQERDDCHATISQLAREEGCMIDQLALGAALTFIFLIITGAFAS
jgi:hypothetical protein